MGDSEVSHSAAVGRFEMDLGQEHRFPEQIKVDYGSLLMMLLF